MLGCHPGSSRETCTFLCFPRCYRISIDGGVDAVASETILFCRQAERRLHSGDELKAGSSRTPGLTLHISRSATPFSRIELVWIDTPTDRSHCLHPILCLGFYY